ncbi:hypothetical protein [Priestia endophytica]|nr:hypothetical protein [Priestia endophytica]MCY8235531.1 hypothetical protein [Priestia endophytica]
MSEKAVKREPGFIFYFTMAIGGVALAYLDSHSFHLVDRLLSYVNF